MQLASGLERHPKVVRIAEALGGVDKLDRDERITLTVGALYRVWSAVHDFADASGFLEGATVDAISGIAKLEGFGEAMQETNWITVSEDGPASVEGVRIRPAWKTILDAVAMNAPVPGAKTPKPKKPKRKRNRKKGRSRSIQDDALAIYEAYPRKGNKVKAIKAIMKILDGGKHVPRNLQVLTQEYAASVQVGDEVPYASVWFNQRKFEGV